MRLKEIVKEYMSVVPVTKCLITGIIVTLFVFNLFQPHFVDELLAGGWGGSLCDSLYSGMESNRPLNIFFVVSAILLSVIACIGLARYKQPLYIPFAILLLIIWIISDNYWMYGSMIWPGDLRWIIAACMMLILCGTCIRIKDEDASPGREESSVKGFTADSNIKEKDKNLVRFASELASKLKETDVRNSSFAVGVESGWGTGKTTFLSYIREALPADSIVMEFNPWLSLSDRSLVTAYFNSLANVVSENLDKDLFSPIQKYGEAIASLDGIGGWIEVFKNYLSGIDRHDVHELKSRIASKLSQLDRKLFVIIDDMDRLDHDELFEVLRLIRNTADFPGIVYIVAYDKGYVAAQLTNRGIRKADIYLEKIFNLEVSLPKTLSKFLQRVLLHELSDMLPENEYPGIEYPVNMIYDILQNYREVKRFAREFSLSLSFMIKQVGMREFNVSDLFLLELIKYHDHELFSDLRDNVRNVLKTKALPGGVDLLELKDELKGQTSVSERFLSLLRSLFDANYQSDSSICYAVNYARYFTFAIEPDILRKESFEEWLKCRNEEETDIWNKFYDHYRRKSLLFQFAKHRTADLSSEQFKRFITGLLRLWSRDARNEKNVQAILLQVLDKEYTPQIVESEFFEWFETEIAKYRTDERLYVSASNLYNRLKTTGCHDVALVNDLERENLKRYLVDFKPDALDIQRSKTGLHQIYEKSLVWESHEYGYDETTGEPVVEKIGSTAIFDVLIEHFKINPSPNKAQFIDEMFYYDEPGPYDETIRVAMDENECDSQIRSYFGQRKYYDDFVDSAFIGNP